MGAQPTRVSEHGQTEKKIFVVTLLNHASKYFQGFSSEIRLSSCSLGLSTLRLLRATPPPPSKRMLIFFHHFAQVHPPINCIVYPKKYLNSKHETKNLEQQLNFSNEKDMNIMKTR